MILCVAPNPSIDKLFAVERLQPGGIHRPAGFVRVPGGKGLNLARAAASLGAEVQAVALLGGHAGRWIEAALAEEGVSLRAVWTAAETRSCLSVADAETESLTEFYEDGSRIDAPDWQAFADLVRKLAAAAGWTTVSGSLPPGAPEGSEAELLSVGRVAADTRKLGHARPALVKVNAAEAAQLTALEVDTGAAALAAAHKLRERIGGEGHAAIVTRGAEGAVLVDPEGRAWHGRLDVSGPFPVGSGDAFLAGLVVALEFGHGWPAALRAGLGAGAANAETPGAGRLVGARAEELADRAIVSDGA